MFGFGKKQNESGESRLKREIDELVHHAKCVEIEKQVLVGYGIQEAEKSFFRKYTIDSFREAQFSEQMAQVDFIRSMETKLSASDGAISILSIGYAMFNRWQGVIMLSDDELIKYVDDQLSYFKDISNSYS
jgi:hypothetical protein